MEYIEKIDNLCNILGAMVSAGMAIESKNVESTFIAGSSAPAISIGLKKVICGIFNNNSSEREFKRLGAFAESAKETFDKNIKQGRTVENYLFINSSNNKKGYVFEEVLENLLKTVKDDTITLKSKIYGRFFGNIPFRNDLDSSNIIFLKEMINSLSFTELCILEVLSRKTYKNLQRLQTAINRENKPILFEFYNGIIKLKNNSLLVPAPPYSVGSEIGNVKSSKMGELICDVAELHIIDRDWLNVTEDLFDYINNYEV